MEKSLSNLVSRFPYPLSFVRQKQNFSVFRDGEGRLYHLYSLKKRDYLLYLELSKSSKIEKCIFETRDKDNYYLLYPCVNMPSEPLAVLHKLYPLLEEVFQDFTFAITLKKEHFTNLNNIYKVLDNKFTYFEMRIREIEVMPQKNDISWIVLSKYYILLDAKMYLYDLQQDIFGFIDKNTTVDYGLIFRSLTVENFKNKQLEPSFQVYLGAFGMLLVRLFFYFDHLNIQDFFKEKLKKCDEFNQKYFCFMVIYIYILNMNLDILLNPYNIGNYLQLTKKISSFIRDFGDYLK